MVDKDENILGAAWVEGDDGLGFNSVPRSQALRAIRMALAEIPEKCRECGEVNICCSACGFEVFPERASRS